VRLVRFRNRRRRHLLSSVNTGDAANDTFTFINNVFGSNFNDHITGNNNANKLDGGFGGSDQLTGLGGADTFIFHGNKLTITDFNQGGGAFNPGEGDQIDLTGFGLTPAEFNAVINASSGSELTLGNGNVIELPGVDVHLLTLTNNFIHS
jgi:Ca2+-binding RTX toxin-like protein